MNVTELEQISNYSKTLEEQNADYKRIVNESQQLVRQLTSEYTNKINQANKIIEDQAKQGQEKQDNSTTKK
jgi:hypothetical protein